MVVGVQNNKTPATWGILGESPGTGNPGRQPGISPLSLIFPRRWWKTSGTEQGDTGAAAAHPRQGLPLSREKIAGLGAGALEPRTDRTIGR